MTLFSVLTTPSATAMRRLLTLCDSCARDYCISFNAHKTKCMIVMPCKGRDFSSYLDSCIFRIDNKPIDCVNSFSHLGHLITSSLYDDEDIVRRRGDFIGQVNNVICYFRELNSFVRNNLFRSYCTSFYGCELWSLDIRQSLYDDLSIASGADPRFW